MFHVSRWAGMFLTVSGENAQEAFLCLKALAFPVKSASGVFFGSKASEKLETILRESVAAADNAKLPVMPVEYAIRFLCLLVEKNSLKHIDLILSRIESMLNKKNGMLDITIESAAPLDDDFSKELAQMVKEKTGAVGVNMKTCVKPELLGGCLLRADGFYIDATLKGQADKMMTQLIGIGEA
jgi:ATP synthase F1 delta subunit